MPLAPVLAAISAAAAASPTLATVITFDDVTSSSYSTIPNGYAGMNWNNFGVVSDGFYTAGTSGYNAGVVSPRYVAYNMNGDPVSLTSVSGGVFAVDGLYLTAAWNDGLYVNVKGYDAISAGNLVYNSTLTPSAIAPTYYGLGHVGVKRLEFSSYGGTLHPGYVGGGTHFAVDNLLLGGGGNWLNSTGGSWQGLSNWAYGTPPTYSDDGIFNLPSTYTVSLSANATANNVYLPQGAVTFDLAGHALSLAGDLEPATVVGQTANFTVNNSAGSAKPAVFNASNFYPAFAGATETTLNSNITVNLTGTFSVGNNSQGYGDAYLNGTTFHAAGDVVAGGAGNGYLFLSNNATLTSGRGFIGQSVGYGGAIGLASGSSWNVTHSLYVGGTDIAGAGSATLTVNATATLTVGGTLKVWNTGPSTAGLVLSGGTVRAGALDFSGNVDRFNNNWTSGTLAIESTGSDLGGTLVVPVDGTLAGVGTINDHIYVAGHLAPGDPEGTGTLHTSSITLAPSSNFDIQIAGPLDGQFDVLDSVDALINVNGAYLNLSFLNGYQPAVNTSFTILRNDGADPILGFFANTTPTPFGYDTLNAFGQTFHVYYNGGDGNDVTITAADVPEPASFATLMLPVGLALLRRRRP